MFEGKLVKLRPAELSDARPVFEWLTASDLTSSMLGPPVFPDVPVPSWEQFCLEYPHHFFDGSHPETGRSFIIELNGQAVGHVNYDGLGGSRPYAELDIWMRSRAHCGQGYGSDAIDTLVSYLQDHHHVNEFVLRPSLRNTRAIRAYERAGFHRQEMPEAEQTRLYGPGEYFDAVLMLKQGAT